MSYKNDNSFFIHYQYGFKRKPISILKMHQKLVFKLGNKNKILSYIYLFFVF